MEGVYRIAEAKLGAVEHARAPREDQRLRT